MGWFGDVPEHPALNRRVADRAQPAAVQAVLARADDVDRILIRQDALHDLDQCSIQTVLEDDDIPLP